MNFLQTSRSKWRRLGERRQLFVAIAAAAAVLAGIVFIRPPVPDTIASAGHQAGAPMWEIKNNIVGAVYGAFLSLDSKEALVAENIQLREEASELRGEAFQAKLLEYENKKLKELLGRSSPGRDKELLASVLRTVNMAPYDALIIDAGANDGVVEGDLVAAQGGIAIGSVRKVFANTATVMLFSAPDEKTAVLVGATSTIPVVALGQGGGTFIVKMPRDAAVFEGDPVVLSSIDSVMFAEVEKITNDPASSFKTALFRSPINMAQLRYVIIKRGVVWQPDPAALQSEQGEQQKKDDSDDTKEE